MSEWKLHQPPVRVKVRAEDGEMIFELKVDEKQMFIPDPSVWTVRMGDQVKQVALNTMPRWRDSLLLATLVAYLEENEGIEVWKEDKKIDFPNFPYAGGETMSFLLERKEREGRERWVLSREDGKKMAINGSELVKRCVREVDGRTVLDFSSLKKKEVE